MTGRRWREGVMSLVQKVVKNIWSIYIRVEAADKKRRAEFKRYFLK